MVLPVRRKESERPQEEMVGIGQRGSLDSERCVAAVCHGRPSTLVPR